MENNSKKPVKDSTQKSKFEEYFEPLLVIIKCWILPMTNAEFHYPDEKTLIRPDWLALTLIAFLVLSVLPDLSNHTGQAALVVGLSGGAAIILSFISRLIGKAINSGIVVNAYTSLAICLLFFLIISQFNLLSFVGVNQFSEGSYINITIFSSLITFMIWILKSLLWHKEKILPKEYFIGFVVITVCGLITYLIADFNIEQFKGYLEFLG
jgi:hypothetical protein